MKCPECETSGLRSRVTIHGGSSTCIGWSPFCDEDGVFHSHDPNTHTSGFSCSNGHYWSVSSKAKCPNCDYGAK